MKEIELPIPLEYYYTPDRLVKIFEMTFLSKVIMVYDYKIIYYSEEIKQCMDIEMTDHEIDVLLQCYKKLRPNADLLKIILPNVTVLIDLDNVKYPKRKIQKLSKIKRKTGTSRALWVLKEFHCDSDYVLTHINDDTMIITCSYL